MARSRRDLLLRWAAPAAFLAVVTIVVVVIHTGLSDGGSTPSPTVRSSPIVRTQTAPTATKRGRRRVARYYTVQTGDTFGAIAAKEGTTVGRLQQLNPGVSSNALQVGQKIRVK